MFGHSFAFFSAPPIFLLQESPYLHAKGIVIPIPTYQGNEPDWAPNEQDHGAIAVAMHGSLLRNPIEKGGAGLQVDWKGPGTVWSQEVVSWLKAIWACFPPMRRLGSIGLV